MRFVEISAARLLELAALAPGTRVLDLATGTGLVAMAAELVGPAGLVVGVDLAPEMLAKAQEKLADSGYSHVSFQEGDAERLDFPDQCFDIVLCASSLFFVPDMPAALRECRRVLIDGGRIGFSAFGPTFLQPLWDLWMNRLQQHGLPAQPSPAQRLADPMTCRQLLVDAGFTDVEPQTEQLGYYLSSFEERWEQILVSLEVLPWSRLPSDQRDQIKAEHLAELRPLVTPQGIWVDVPVHFAFGSKPAA